MIDQKKLDNIVLAMLSYTFVALMMIAMVSLAWMIIKEAFF